jgi:large subunit ribosomal protein L22
MEFTAKARFVRVSPQKARLVLGLIKGKRVEAALNTLAFTNKGIAPEVLKVLRSALENANYQSTEKGLDVDVDNLYVKSAVANEGPRMKRIRPAPMGRAYRYQRRMAHIEIALAEKGKAVVAAEASAPAAPEKKVVRKPAAKKAATKKPAPKKAATDKPAEKKPAGKKPAAKKPAAKKAPKEKK